MPARRPPASVLRTVSAVSWPGVTITTTATPRNASSSAIRRAYATVITTRPRARPDSRWRIASGTSSSGYVRPALLDLPVACRRWHLGGAEVYDIRCIVRARFSVNRR